MYVQNQKKVLFYLLFRVRKMHSAFVAMLMFRNRTQNFLKPFYLALCKNKTKLIMLHFPVLEHFTNCQFLQSSSKIIASFNPKIMKRNNKNVCHFSLFEVSKYKIEIYISVTFIVIFCFVLFVLVEGY